MTTTRRKGSGQAKYKLIKLPQYTSASWHLQTHNTVGTVTLAESKPKSVTWKVPTLDFRINNLTLVLRDLYLIHNAVISSISQIYFNFGGQVPYQPDNIPQNRGIILISRRFYKCLAVKSKARPPEWFTTTTLPYSNPRTKAGRCMCSSMKGDVQER